MKKHELIDFLIPFSDEIEIEIPPLKYVFDVFEIGGEGKIVVDTSTNSAMDAIALCKRLLDFVNSNGELRVSESSYWYCELEKIAQQHHSANLLSIDRLNNIGQKQGSRYE